MKNLIAELQSTALHTLELAVCIGAAILVVREFRLGPDQMAIPVSIAFAAIAKFARVSEKSPVPDYVNPK